MSQTMLVNILSAVAFIGSLVLEHFGLVPVGTEQSVLLVVAGLVAGTGSAAALKGQPVVNVPASVATQGTIQAPAPIVDPGNKG